MQKREQLREGLNVLIAEPHDILRMGLRVIFAEDERVAHIYEAATSQNLQTYVQNRSVDLLIVNQSLVTDITSLPRGRFVIIAEEIDMSMFQIAYKHGARGYLLANTPADLLLATLRLTDEAFLIGPTIAAQVIEYFSSDSRLLVREELLTPREKEVVALLREGVDRPTIARLLSISEATLKTHIKNIMKKREETWSKP